MANITPVAANGHDGVQGTKRKWYTDSGLVVDTVLATCEVLDFREFRELAVKPSAGITGLSVYASESAAGTYVLVDSIGTNGAVTVVASKWNVLDTTKIGPFGYLKFVPNTNGTLIVQVKT